MEKPYIEHNGVTYEFEANFTLKKEYEKTLKSFAFKLSRNKDIDFEKMQSIQKKLQEKENIKEEELKKDEELVNDMLELTPFLEDFDMSDIYENYCFKMLKVKYDITKEKWEEILNGMSEDYGFENTSLILQKVCEKVFTQTVEQKETKKPLPNWLQ